MRVGSHVLFGHELVIGCHDGKVGVVIGNAAQKLKPAHAGIEHLGVDPVGIELA